MRLQTVLILLVFALGCDGQSRSAGELDAQGLRSGTWTFSYTNGQKEKAGNYVAGAEDGPWQSWYPSGQRKSLGHYRSGKKTGEWTFWYESGQKQKQGTYQKDVEVGQWTFWYESGQRQREGTYLDGVQLGEWNLWDEQGRKSVELYAGSLSTELETLVAQLESPVEAKRVEAAQKLKAQGKNALPAWVRALQSRNDLAQSAGANALRDMGPSAAGAATALIDAFRDETLQVRDEASEALLAIGPASLGPVIKGLSDPNMQVRLHACVTLGKFGALDKLHKEVEAAVPDLARILRSDHPDVRRAAAVALGSVGPAGLAVLAQGLRDPQATVRGYSAAGLASTTASAEEAVPILAKSLAERDPTTAKLIANAFAQFGLQSVPTLLESFRTDNQEVCRNASLALTKIGKSAVPALIQAVEGENPGIRTWSVVTLGRLGPEARDAIPVLRRIPANDSVSSYAVEALKQIGN